MSSVAGPPYARGDDPNQGVIVIEDRTYVRVPLWGGVWGRVQPGPGDETTVHVPVSTDLSDALDKICAHLPDPDAPYHCGYHESLCRIAEALGLPHDTAHVDIATEAIRRLQASETVKDKA